jgi:myo-inositol-1(or 4)-monophosphatase
MDLETIKRIGIRAAFQAGRILIDHFNKPLQVKKKGAIDLVTQADIASEKAIIATIQEVFPEHGILAEESGDSPGNGHDCWLIDPLDGTTNFAHHLPIFAVSIAYSRDGIVLMGIVFNPANGELFTAVHGQGARLNDTPVHVSNTDIVGDSLLVTGFPYTLRFAAPDKPIARFTRCLTAAQGVRRLGSAALDLCYVACGRFEGFWEENLKPWDTAAGLLIVQEAGGKISDYKDRAFHLNGKQILATNACIHQEMVQLLDIEDCA